MAIAIERLTKGKLGYKMASYSDWCPFTNLTMADDSGQWAGWYVAPVVEVAEGYGTDYLGTTGAGTAYMHEVHLLSDVNLIVCDDPVLGGTTLTGEQKATLVRSQLPATIRLGGGPLIPELGRLGFFFKGFHDADNMELIVPNKLSAFVALMKAATYSYRGWAVTGKTAHPV